MAPQLESAIVSTPVSDCAVSQGEETTTEEDSKQMTSEIKALQDDAGCPGQVSIRPSRASSSPAGHRDDAPVQTSPSLAASGPLGQHQTLGIELFSHSLPPQCTVHQAISDNRLAPGAPCLGSDICEPDAALVGDLPKGLGKKCFSSFFSFPAEIRNMIYSHALHWPDSSETYRPFYRQNLSPNTDRPHASKDKRNLKTPTILLLCRQITQESLPVLRSRSLVIDRLPPFGPKALMKMSNFIGRRTLQSLNHLDIRIGLGEGPLGSGWIWMKLLDDILAVLSERNAFIRLRLLVRMCEEQDVARWDQERECIRAIHKVRMTTI